MTLHSQAEVDDVVRWTVSTYDLAIAHPGIPNHVVGAAGGLSHHKIPEEMVRAREVS